MTDWKTRAKRVRIPLIKWAQEDPEDTVKVEEAEAKLAAARAAWGREKDKVDHLDTRIAELEAELRRLRRS